MNIEIVLFAIAIGATCLGVGANAAPMALAPIDAPATQIRDHEGGDMARQIFRGVTGRGVHRTAIMTAAAGGIVMMATGTMDRRRHYED